MFSQSMSGCLLATLTILFCQIVVILAVGETYDARCDVGKTADQRTVDTCDRERFLACKEGRCLCQDQANQIWTYRTVKGSSRSRRSPKKGGGKKIIAAAGAGAVGGFIAGHAIRGGSSSSSSGSSKKEKTYPHYGCYSRVKGQCVLDNSLIGGDVIVAINKPVDSSVSTTSTTTTSSIINATTAATPVNVTTAAPGAPQALAQTYTYDVTRIPKCVEHAECKPIPVKIVDGKVVSDGSHDPRLGVCECKAGYKASKTDRCEKSGAFRINSGLLFVFLSIGVNLISKSLFN